MRPRDLVPLLLLAAAVVLVGVSWARTWREIVPWCGLSFGEERGRVVVTDVHPDGPAAGQDVRQGDVVVSISGKPVRRAWVARDLVARVRPGAPLGLTLVRDGAPHHVRLRTLAVVRWYPERILDGVVALLFLAAAAAVLARPRRRGSFVVHAMFCLAGALLLGVSWSSRGDGIDWVLFWADRAARLAFPALWIHLVLLLGGRPRTRRWLPVAWAPPVAFLLAEIHLVGLGGALRAREPVSVIDLLQSRLEIGWIACGFLAGLAILATRAFRRGGDPTEKVRYRWILAGTTLGLLPWLTVAAVPAIVAGRELPWSFLAVPALGLVPLTFTGAVLEYRLMDLAFFLRRGLELSAALGFSLLLFLGLLSVARWVVPFFVRPSGLLPVVFAVLGTAALAPAIRAGTRDLVRRLYYRRRYSFRRALARLGRDLSAEQELPRIARVLEHRVREALDAGVVRLLLRGEGERLVDPETGRPVRARLGGDLLEQLAAGRSVTLAMIPGAPRLVPGLHREGVQVLVPLRIEGRLIAVLAVGPRKAGNLLDSDDLELLRTVASHAASAVAGALHLQELRSQVDLVRRLSARAEALIESSPMGMAVIDREGRIRHWNAALEQLLGVPRDQVLGRDWREVFPLGLLGAIGELLAGGDRGRAYRVRVPTPGRGERRINLVVSPLQGPPGDDGILLVLDDVTEQVLLEDRLIQQDRLASVGLLAAGVAHEVNTPLTGISSYAQILLEETREDDPRRPLLEKIVRQADRASRIARGLLTLSRPAGARAPGRGPVDLVELAEETASLLAVHVRRAGASLEVVGEGRGLVVVGDRSRLQQVVMNLLLNALDAVGEGGHVRVVVAAGESGRVQLVVEDDGPGIPEAIRDRVFDPFFTTKKAGEGTGLGLSISYSIVSEHGGEIVVENGKERGTRMRVLLPAAEGMVAGRRARTG